MKSNRRHNFADMGAGALPPAPGKRRKGGRFFMSPEDQQIEALADVIENPRLPSARCERCGLLYPLDKTRTVRIKLFETGRACHWCSTASEEEPER